MQKAVSLVALALIVAACKSGGDKQRVEQAPEAVGQVLPVAAPRPPADAGPLPERDQAAETLSLFSEKLLADDMDGARVYLRIPTGYTEKQIVYFMQELRDPEHLSAQGVTQVLSGEFGPLVERFGDQALDVAEGLDLPLESTYAFGDLSAAALLHWDGKIFRVAALHRLSKPRN